MPISKKQKDDIVKTAEQSAKNIDPSIRKEVSSKFAKMLIEVNSKMETILDEFERDSVELMRGKYSTYPKEVMALTSENKAKIRNMAISIVEMIEKVSDCRYRLLMHKYIFEIVACALASLEFGQADVVSDRKNRLGN